GEGVCADSTRLAIAVSMMPGSTIATRTLNGFTSCANDSLSASNANFDAVYGAMGELAMRPATDATLMMQPLWRARIGGSTAWMQRIAPKQFVPRPARNLA